MNCESTWRVEETEVGVSRGRRGEASEEKRWGVEGAEEGSTASRPCPQQSQGALDWGEGHSRSEL